jgi:hypothetical protein
LGQGSGSSDNGVAKNLVEICHENFAKLLQQQFEIMGAKNLSIVRRELLPNVVVLQLRNL